MFDVGKAQWLDQVLSFLDFFMACQEIDSFEI